MKNHPKRGPAISGDIEKNSGHALVARQSFRGIRFPYYVRACRRSQWSDFLALEQAVVSCISSSNVTATVPSAGCINAFKSVDYIEKVFILIFIPAATISHPLAPQTADGKINHSQIETFEATMSNPSVTAQAIPTLPATILGRQQPRIPTAGKIRAGIKVLTKAAASDPRIRAVYDDGLAHNATFEQIEQKIAEQFPEVKTPLVPKNVAWFTVRPNDFPNPAIARQILGTYGEDRGDSVLRLYRFPVIFPADAWQSVMPHELACWARSEKRYWSEYSNDGQTRRCMMFAPAKVDLRSKRVVRTFGGRGTQPRPDNGGLCDPERCPEFQNRQCNLSGRFIFYIPGIRSLDAFELHTNSFYALSRAIERFEAIAFLRGGRIAGFLDRHGTTFYLTKKLREVSHLDPKTGQPVRNAHWIIELEAPVDVAALLDQRDDETTLRMADAAAQALQGSEPIAHDVLANPAPEDAPSMEEVPGDEATSSHSTRPAPAQLAPTNDLATSADAVYALAASLGVDRVTLDSYLNRTWGAGWCHNPRGIQRVLAELTRMQDDPDGARARIHAEPNAQQ